MLGMLLTPLVEARQEATRQAQIENNAILKVTFIAWSICKIITNMYECTSSKIFTIHPRLKKEAETLTPTQTNTNQHTHKP